MKLSLRRLLAIGAVLALTIGIGGSALAQDTGTDEKLILNVGLTEDFVSPNPFVACCTADYEMLFLNYDMLFNFDPVDLTPAPGLATECTSTSDHMTYTCNIREGVMWSDGQPLTAEDIAFTYTFIVENKGTSVFGDYFPFEPTFEAPDATTLIWHSQKPTFAPEIPPWVYILPKHIWEPLDGASAQEIKGFKNVPSVGSGAFNLVEWEPGQFFRMEANKDYWYGTPTIDEIDFRIFENQEAMVQALRGGEIDFAYDIQPTLANSLEGDPNIETWMSKPGSFVNLAFNFGGQSEAAGSSEDTETNHPALHDVRLRQAIAHAIDRQGIVDTVWLGNALPGDSVMRPDSAFWFYDIPAEDEFAYDPAAAMQILDEAGYTDTDADGVREDPQSGEPLDLEIVTLTDELGSTDTGKLIQGWLGQVGIAVSLTPVKTPKAYEIWEAGTFDAYIWGWGGDIDPDFIMSIHTTQSCLVWSDGCWSDPQFDEWFQQQRSIFDPEERRELIQQMQAYLYEQAPELALVYPATLQAYRTDRFTGYIPTPKDGGDLLFGWGPYSQINLKPVAEGAAPGDSGGGGGGIPVGVWIGLGVAILAVGGFLLSRRRNEEDEA